MLRKNKEIYNLTFMLIYRVGGFKSLQEGNEINFDFAALYTDNYTYLLVTVATET